MYVLLTPVVHRHIDKCNKNPYYLFSVQIRSRTIICNHLRVYILINTLIMFCFSMDKDILDRSYSSRIFNNYHGKSSVITY